MGGVDNAILLPTIDRASSEYRVVRGWNHRHLYRERVGYIFTGVPGREAPEVGPKGPPASPPIGNTYM